MNPHIIEWKKIKQWYEEEYENTPEIKFRIECIDDLINQEEIKDNPEHFK